MLPLTEHFNAVFEVALLTHVLLLDVFVDDGVLFLSVFDEVVELLVDGLLELLVVINVLYDPVDGVLLLVNLIVVLTNNRTELRNLVGHGLLLDAQIVDLETRLRVSLVEVLKVVIEGVGLRAQL